MVEIVQDECIFGHTRLDTIVEGTDTLIKRLSHAIINDVTFNANVNAIRIIWNVSG
ncbi:Laminoacid oxidaselike [Caligus rogercresseyi]|uniref:Laminoacid oxidaselike n=1 Tax=Caligus rogercresseyi TaxID=217165 RepID=A0A7T8QS98_CALRO|nr:Laminoacid oxidaselike [Caligus rogercresseyi]